jgi:hypothetical protein
VKLDGAAPRVVPLLVEVEQEVEAAVHPRPLVVVEIDVRVELLPLEVLVRPAAEEGRVAQEVFHARQRRDGLQKLLRLDVLGDAPVEGADLLYLLEDGLAADLAHLVERLLRVEGREVAEHLLGLGRLKKVVDHDVAEGLGGDELLPVLLDPVENALVNHRFRFLNA